MANIFILIFVHYITEKCRSGLEESHAIMDETSKGSGCRICHRDDDFAKMLLCEGCDDEYHIYCLNPPLKSVPKDDWYCGKSIQPNWIFLSRKASHSHL